MIICERCAGGGEIHPDSEQEYGKEMCKACYYEVRCADLTYTLVRFKVVKTATEGEIKVARARRDQAILDTMNAREEAVEVCQDLLLASSDNGPYQDGIRWCVDALREWIQEKEKREGKRAHMVEVVMHEGAR